MRRLRTRGPSRAAAASASLLLRCGGRAGAGAGAVPASGPRCMAARPFFRICPRLHHLRMGMASAAGPGGESSNKSSWQEYWDEKQQRKETEAMKLEQEMKRSKLQDYYDIAKHRGKTDPPLLKLQPYGKAVLFPSLEVMSLMSGEKFNIKDRMQKTTTVVYLYGSAMAMQMGSEWFSETSAFGKGFNVLEVSLNESWFSRALKPLTKYNLKNQVPKERQDNFCVSYGDISAQREKLGMINKLTLYVFLVDEGGKVRWKATGYPDPEEVEFLRQNIKIPVSSGDGK